MNFDPPYRVELIRTVDSIELLRPLDRGTVVDVDKDGAPVVRWDNGISSQLVEGKDEWVSRWVPAGAFDGFAALALLELMEDISEEGWCAGWMDGLEESLWWIAHGGDPMYGRCLVSEERVTALRGLADRAGGWWYFDDEKPIGGDLEETFIALEEWEQRFATRAQPEWVEDVRSARGR